MTGSPADVDVADLIDNVEEQLVRTVDRLRSVTLVRLGHPEANGLTPADRAHRLSSQLVSITYRIRARGALDAAGDAVPRLPRLADHAAGDQLRVVGGELLAAVRDGADLRAEPRTELQADVTCIARQLLELRQSI
ncbi:MAG: hypothetical protein Q8P61_04705 [Candidatus Nanopelagicales bacterium]|nr:hypothetical protein [Candidatus Nanopelagicales bacterium]